MKKFVWIIASVLLISLCFTGVSLAKFKCKTEDVDLEAGTLVLKDCEKKGLKKIKIGNTVSITKKRKQVEGC